ncbi:MAG TPA: methyltransferase domain-containing protein [Acidimicrobiales bacterium]|nr:methyltransferase domain-containing protein [Acidimicrobiales bacterium]
MAERYRFPFGPDTPYANVVDLVSRHHRGGVVVDVGCGYGAVAEPLADLGLEYLGVDVAPDGLADLARRGFDTVEADLAEAGGWLDDVVKALDHRPLAGVLALDVIEHLADPRTLIAGLRDLVEQAGPAPLVVCVPNVAHLDLGTKLLLGRWEVTPTGLLDATHLSLYTEDRLAADLARGGFREIDRADFHLTRSDQHTPEDCVALSEATTLGAFLGNLRRNAGPNATVNQFVRAYVPELLPDGRRAGLSDEAEANDSPFLTVVMRTQGRRNDTLAEALLSLAAQTDQDFEVVVVAHDLDPGAMAGVRDVIADFSWGPVGRARLVPVRGGGRSRPLNAGVAEARGSYVAILDDDDLALAHWVETFHRIARAHPGQVVRSGVATVSLGRLERLPTPAVSALEGTVCYPSTFDLLDHLLDNATPSCGLAIPRSCFRDLGLAFDEDLPVLEDWDLLLQAAPYCGVADTGEVTGLYRKWEGEANSLTIHPPEEWDAARATIRARLEARPFLLSGTAMAQLRRALATQAHPDEAPMAARIEELERELAARDQALAAADRARAEAEANYAEIRSSRSWRAACVLRGVGWMARKARGSASR